MIGWHCSSLSSLRSAFIECNSIQTTLCLSYKILKWVVMVKRRSMMILLLFPVLHDLAEMQRFEIVLASASRDTTEKSLFFVFFSVCETQHANERVLLGLGPLAQRWEPFIRRGDNCTSYDEKLCQFTFAVSTLASWSNSPSAECFTFPSWSCWTQKAIRQVWATNKDWCAEQKAGVDAMWEFVTFLWMSELLYQKPHLTVSLTDCFHFC
jgi:hypothetical protein